MKNLFIPLVVSTALIAATNQSQVGLDSFTFKDRYKTITVKSVIEQGLRNSYEEKISDLQVAHNILSKKDVFSKYWLPNVSMSISTDPFKIARVKSGSLESSVGNSYFGIAVEDYTIFNWGKDQLAYEIIGSRLDRENKELKEKRDERRHLLISKFLDILYNVKRVDLSRDEFRQSEYLYRLVKDRLSVRKASLSDFYLARSFYLESQSRYQEALRNAALYDESMSYLLNDPKGTRYQVVEEVIYKNLRVSIDDMIKIAKEENRTLKTYKNNLDTSFKALQLAKKNRLPLPKVALTVGTWTKGFGTGETNTRYETYNGGNQVDVAAMLSASWPLFGPGGTMNSREVYKRELENKMAGVKYKSQNELVSVSVRGYLRDIRGLEKQYSLLKSQLDSVTKLTDNKMDTFVNKRGSVDLLTRILKDQTEVSLKYEKVKVDLAKRKLSLGTLMGVTDFPGDNFENLVQTVSK